MKSALQCAAFCSGVSLLAGGVLHAETEQEEGEQPVQDLFQSILVYPQERNELQFTSSPSFRKGQDENQWLLPLAVEYGVTDAFQVGAEWLAYKHRDPEDEPSEEGVGDLELETQYSWMSIGDRPVHAALALAVRIPTGDEDKELGEGSVAAEPVAILAVDLAALNGGQLFFNLGAEIDKDQTEKLINVGAFMPLRNWVPSLEWNWSEDAEERYLTPGLTWHADDAWYFGLGVPVGLNDEADDYRLIFQIVYERMGH